MPISLEEFVRSLSDTGILPPDEMTTFVTSLPEDRATIDVEQLARELVRQHKLTRFQASVIFRRQARGLRFGDYVVLDKLGSGGMGQVFKAENRQSGKVVALKLLRASYTKSDKAVARFYRESSTASRFKHPNLVSVVEAGEFNGLHFLVMELVDGRDIRSIIKEHGPFSVRSSVEIAVQVAKGMEYAHQQGIVHRDIKPGNLLLDRKGRVVVLDLGLARLDESTQEDAGDDSGRLTMPGHFLGTFDYISPEQTADAHDVDARTDIYSLGCTLYYLMHAAPPYRRENAALILFAHCNDPIPSLATGVPGVPDRLEALFTRMVAKKAADRIPSMTEVIAELEECRREIRELRKSSTSISVPGLRPAEAAVGAGITPGDDVPAEYPLPPMGEATTAVAEPSTDSPPAPLPSPAPATRPDHSHREDTNTSYEMTVPDSARLRRADRQDAWLTMAGAILGGLLVFSGLAYALWWLMHR